MSTIRTCIVSERNGEARLKPEDECSFSDEVLTYFIERDPLLDLLERAYKNRRTRTIYELKGVLVDQGVAAFLRAHGRLGGET